MENQLVNPKLAASLVGLSALKSELDTVANNCLQIKVICETSLSIAQQNLSKANGLVKAVEAKRVELKQPSIDEGRLIDSTAKNLTGALNTALVHAKNQIKSFEIKKQEEIAKKLMLAKTEEDAAQIELEEEASKTTRLRSQWKFEVADVTQIPREWLCIDEAKVKEYMSVNKEFLKEGTVDGVRFFKDIIVTA